MTAFKVRADYAQLTQIAQAFAGQAECAQQLLGALQQDMATLQAGDWVGKSADKFYLQMSTAVLPAMQRVVAAMSEAASTTTKISQVMKQAENDAAALFRLDGAGSARNPGPSTSSGPAPAPAFASGGDGTPGAGSGSTTGRAGPAPGGSRARAGAAQDSRVARIQRLLDEGHELRKTYEAAVADTAQWKVKYEEARRLNKDPGEIQRLEAGLRSAERDEQFHEVSMTGRYNAAIELTIQHYKIDLTGVRLRPGYIHNIDSEGRLLPGNEVAIGPGGVSKSPGWLASTLGHEAVHARQRKEGRLYGNKQGILLNDVECYQWELDNAERHGLTEAETNVIRDGMETRYILLTEKNQKRVNRRVFTLAPEK